jgi:HAD superfamily hydrolase (TIGR01549 family)
MTQRQRKHASSARGKIDLGRDGQLHEANDACLRHWLRCHTLRATSMTQRCVMDYGYEDDRSLRGRTWMLESSKGERMTETEQVGALTMIDQQRKALRPIRAIVLDAFGTLCEIRDKRGPFAKLARLSPDRAQARELLMTRPLTLRQAASELHVEEEVDLDQLEADLRVELASIQLFPEVAATLEAVRASGIKLAVASNLAAPYAEPLLRLLPIELDVYAWSFEVGALKPDPRIFQWTCEALGVEPADALMVGDTLQADYEGARAVGMRALHLDRTGNFFAKAQTVMTLHMLPRANELFK